MSDGPLKRFIGEIHRRSLWSDTYNRKLTGILAIQDEIAEAIVERLRDEALR